MHLNWVLVASKMQSLRHGFAKRTTILSPLLILRFKCRTAYYYQKVSKAITTQPWEVYSSSQLREVHPVGAPSLRPHPQPWSCTSPHR